MQGRIYSSAGLQRPARRYAESPPPLRERSLYADQRHRPHNDAFRQSEFHQIFAGTAFDFARKPRKSRLRKVQLETNSKREKRTRSFSADLKRKIGRDERAGKLIGLNLSTAFPLLFRHSPASVRARALVISEPQAGRPGADEQLVIWCRLRYRSLGVEVSAGERRAAARVRRRAPATCVQRAVAVWCPVPWELNRMCCSYRRDVMAEAGSAWLI